MQVFKAFFKILNKNKMAMLIYMGIFFSLMIVMTKNGEEKDVSKFMQENLKIAVENQDSGGLGEALAEYLSLKNTIREVPKERTELLDAMYYEEIQYVLVIPEDFTEKFMKGERDELLEGTKVPGASKAFLAEMEINKFLQTLGVYADGGYDVKTAAAKTSTVLKEEGCVEFLTKDNVQERPAAYHYFQYIPYIFVSVMLVSLSFVLMAFNEKNLDARNKCSAMSFAKRNGQMILGSIGVMLLEYGVFIVVALAVYPEYMLSVKGFLSALNAFAFMLVCLGITFFVGRLARNDGELNMIANIVGLAFSFLGGVFVPLELLSDGVRKVSKFVPSYWYILSNREIWKIETLAEAGDIYRNCLVMLAFAVAILAAAVMVNRLKAREG